VRKVSRKWRRLAAVILLGSAKLVLAQPAAEPLEEAKALFREGVALLNAGDPERALESFLKSRAIVPSGKNTANAAICLERLGRYDEALELYEELLARFAGDLDQQDREKLAPIMATLRERLGRLDISATVDAALVVDGKPRGNLPRTTPLRLLPGKHRVRLIKDGYRTFERDVDVVVGQTLTFDAELEPLAGLGALRVEQAGSGVGRVFIDGKPVGETPWEGTMPAGMHLLQIIVGDRGSMPEEVEVIERRTMFLRVASQPLGQPLRVTVSPANASLFLEKTRLARGEWLGRLPVGEYELRASAPGYLTKRQRVASQPGAPAEAIRVTLEPDSALATKGSWSLSGGAEAGLLLAPQLNGGQEDEQGSQNALGGRAEALLDAQHDIGLGLRLGVGYAFARQAFERQFTEARAQGRIDYELDQELVLGGPYARLALRARAPLPWKLALQGEAGFGLLFWRYEAAASGSARTGMEELPAVTTGLAPVSDVAPVVTAALQIERSIDRTSLSVGLGSWFVPTSGPTYSESEVLVTGSCTPASLPDALGCASSSGKMAHERVHGPFFLLTPSVAARYAF
jgi:hypothetical protein